MGEPTLSCGSLTEAAIRNGVPESSAKATSRIKRPLPRHRIAWNHQGKNLSARLSREGLAPPLRAFRVSHRANAGTSQWRTESELVGLKLTLGCQDQ